LTVVFASNSPIQYCLIQTSDGIIFLFCQIISYVVKTNLWYRDLVITSSLKLEISKFVHFAKTFQKIIINTLNLNFFKFLAFFQSVLVVSYLLIQQRKSSLNYRSFSKPYPCNIDSFKTPGLWPRPVTFESKMRPGSFKTETETCKNGLETKSQDFITANNPTKLLNQKSCKIYWLTKIAIFLWSDNFSWSPLWSTCMVQAMQQQWNSSQHQPHVVYTWGKWAVNYLFCVHRQQQH